MINPFYCEVLVSSRRDTGWKCERDCGYASRAYTCTREYMHESKCFASARCAAARQGAYSDFTWTNNGSREYAMSFTS